jgi:tetratricopeptide (TPR) repeat protein
VLFPKLSGFVLLLGLVIGVQGAAAYAAGHPLATPAELSRVKALRNLENPSSRLRIAAVARLGAVGTMADADRVVSHLYDSDAEIRQVTGATLWQIWSRSGDKSIDALYQQGVAQMAASKLRDAVATFTTIIAKRPAFAEAWNKRATLYYLLGELDLSLNDCDEVIKRNRHHFGALSGYVQIYLQKGDVERAATYLERALKINPNLEGVVETIEQLQEKQDEKRRNSI